MRKERNTMKFGKVKKIFSTVLLVGTAIGAAVNVFESDRKDKEFEQMKKQLAELTKEK